MGPFKQIKDGGLDTRKVAFECMYTLLDNSLDRLDIFEFLQHVEDGLKDHYDIKVSWMALIKFLLLQEQAGVPFFGWLSSSGELYAGNLSTG